MIYNRQTRRQFLRAGGTVLALPFLTSLWPRSAWGQTPGDKRFIAVWGPYGGYNAADLYPTYAASTPTQLASHTIYSSPLTLSPQLGSISKIYSAALNPFLAKLNVIEGLDCPLDFTHGENTFLGHYKWVRGADGPDQLPYPDVPSIDQFLAYHPKFYPTAPAARSINGFDGWQASSRMKQKTPGNFASGTTALGTDSSPTAVFNKLFGPNTPALPNGTPTGPTPQQLNQKTMVDQVLGEINSLKNNRKISSADKVKLDNFATEMHELQQKLNQAAQQMPQVYTCVKPANPNMSGAVTTTLNDPDRKRYFDLYTSVVAAGIKCGRTKMVTMYGGYFDVEGSNQIYGDPWHQWGHDGKTSNVATTLRWGVENIYAPLLAKLNVEEANGQTFLDNSIVVYGNDNSKIHKSWSRPILTAGSAGGYLKTGMYVDYRQRGVTCPYMYYATGEAAHEMYPGIIYNQFLVTVLQAMGLQPSDYEQPGVIGYSGVSLLNNNTGDLGMQYKGAHVHAKVINDAGKVLPLLVLG